MTGLIAEWVGVGVFALTGALVAARKSMDPFGFALLATVTGIGGGSVRDMLLGVARLLGPGPQRRHHLHRRRQLHLSGGIAHSGPHDQPASPQRAALGRCARPRDLRDHGRAEGAVGSGAHPFTAVVLGTLTATFGGIIRDILAGDTPLVLHREIYVTAAAIGAGVFALAVSANIPVTAAGAVAIATAFGLRGLAILRDWSLPPFKARVE